MTDASRPPSTPGGESESSAVQETAQQAAAGAQEKAQQASAKAETMVREQVDQRSTEAGEKVSGTAADLRAVGEELRNQGKETPAKVAEKAAERTEQLGSYLSESDADRILADIEDFGRRQPLAVLAGGLVVGIAAARFLKASSRNRYQGRFEAESRTRELRQPQPGAGFDTRPLDAGATSPQEVPVAADPVAGR